MYRNSSTALLSNLHILLREGHSLESRLGPTQELIAQVINIEKPDERVYLLPSLPTNIFAQIADSWWVMSGTNDLEFLEYYWPSAQNRSDDRITWRGAYGPRIRNWNGIDQVAQVIEMLQKRPEARRATMTIYDPMHDFAQSKDVACAVALHFLIRDNKLHLTVDMRSVDIWLGGFCGPNTFEWSILQECMAFWLGVGLGPMHFLANSLHMYETDRPQIEQVLQNRPLKTLYENKEVNIYQFQTPMEQFNKKIKLFFELENKLRKNETVDPWLLEDDLLQASLLMLEIYICHQDESRRSKIPVILKRLDNSDFHFAALEWLERREI